MPIDQTHPEYDEMAPRWVRMRDVLAGEDEVKAKGRTYLPMLDQQDADEYFAYKERPEFLAATARTHEGLTGMIFRKPPTYEYPETQPTKALIDKFTMDADLRGNTIENYCRMVTEQVLAVGRGGTLVDWNEDEQRPVAAFYDAESIINWRTERIGGVMMLTLVCLMESYCEDQVVVPAVNSTDEDDGANYAPEAQRQVRVLRLVPQQFATDEGGMIIEQGEDVKAVWVYTVELWREVAEEKRDGAQWVLVKRSMPLRKGKPLLEIPFVWHSMSGTDTRPDKPPLLDLASLNLRHYRVSADYAHGLHFVALPTAWVAGFPKEARLTIGASSAWVSEDVNARAGFLEFTGKGLSEYTSALERLETQMAVMGARLLEQQKREAETAEAMKIRQSGESSVLARIAESCSESLTRVMQWAVWWTTTVAEPAQIAYEQAHVALNSDFVSEKMSTQDVINLTQAYLTGGISQATLLWNLEQGERLPPDVSPEDEAEILANQKVNMGEPAKDDDDDGTPPPAEGDPEETE